MPRLRVEYLDLNFITAKYREDIDLMKQLYGHHVYVEKNREHKQKESVGDLQVNPPSMKYTQDIFYLAPFYHKMMPENLKKMIVLDIDLEFRLLSLYP